MNTSNISDFSKYIYSLFHDINQNDLEYIYKGDVTPELISNILNLAKTNLANSKDTMKVRSRIYFIMGEGLQNVTRHKDESDNSELDSLIVINKKKEKYAITTGNPIKKEGISDLKEKIDNINSMSVSELRNFARYIRKTLKLTEKGGASLGLVEIAKRSGNKLTYTFKDIESDASISYFYFNTEILTNHIKTDNLREKDTNYLEKVKKFHEFLNEENILLSFKGDFNQENVLYLLDILKGQMPASTLTIKVNNILIEILQNISKHADNINKITEWKPGIFFIHKKDGKFILTASNYILNSKVSELSESIELVNSLDKQEIKNLYKTKILDQEEEISSKKTGLGIIDIKKRCKNNFNYNFLKIDNKHSFFTLQIII